MLCAHCLPDHACVYLRMLAMLGMAGAVVASAAGLMTTARKYSCCASGGPPVHCLFVVRVSSVLFSCTCNSEIVSTARVLVVVV